MNKIDLVMLGGGIHSGKTRAQQELVQRGYLGLIFSDNLKHLLVKMLAGVEDDTGERFTYEDVAGPSKARMRGLLAEIGIAFDIDNKSRWTATALRPWRAAGRPSAVVESIRTPAQYKNFSRYGFKLVWLDIDLDEQRRRARAFGVSPRELDEMNLRSSESHAPWLREHARLVLDTSKLTPEEVACAIIAA